MAFTFNSCRGGILLMLGTRYHSLHRVSKAERTGSSKKLKFLGRQLHWAASRIFERRSVLCQASNAPQSTQSIVSGS